MEENRKEARHVSGQDDLRLVNGCDHPEEIASLFGEYTDYICARDDEIRGYLGQQHYDEEVRHLEVKYGEPYGRLYLALQDGKPAGCIALRKMDEEKAELKRLYVRPEFQGHHIADRMIGRILDDAREIGYRHVLLDTIPFMHEAQHLYRKHGFREVEKYNDSPMTHAIYMEKDF